MKGFDALGVAILALGITSSSPLIAQSNPRPAQSGGRLVPPKDFGKLRPFYTYNCDAQAETPLGQFIFNRFFGPDGKLNSIHAEWRSVTTLPPTQPSIYGVWNIEHGADFDLNRGRVFIQWEFVPALKPAAARARLEVDGLTVSSKPAAMKAPRTLLAMGTTNSLASGSAGWGDFVGAARNGAVRIRVEVSSTSPAWKSQLYPGYLTGLKTTGNYGLEKAIGAATLAQVAQRLRTMAAQTAVNRPTDVPRRCKRGYSHPMVEF